MKRNNIIIWLVMILLLAPMLWIIVLQTTGQIKFIADRFAEEYLKFLASLASITFGFILINVLWASREQREKISRGKGVLLNYLLRIRRMSSKIIEMLSLRYLEDELEASQARDAEIHLIVAKVEKLARGMETTAFDPFLYNDIVVNKVFVEIMWEEILPNIDVLALANQHDFRENYEVFVNAIREIQKCSDDGIGYLTGSKKVEA